MVRAIFAGNSLMDKVPLEKMELRDGELVDGEGAEIGNYKLLQEIGRGGFGVVYLAKAYVSNTIPNIWLR